MNRYLMYLQFQYGNWKQLILQSMSLRRETDLRAEENEREIIKLEHWSIQEFKLPKKHNL